MKSKAYSTPQFHNSGVGLRVGSFDTFSVSQQPSYKRLSSSIWEAHTVPVPTRLWPASPTASSLGHSHAPELTGTAFLLEGPGNTHCAGEEDLVSLQRMLHGEKGKCGTHRLSASSFSLLYFCLVFSFFLRKNF